MVSDFFFSTFRFRFILEQVLKNGLTGKVAFDENGDRINAEYEVINIQEVNETGIIKKKHVTVGQYIYNKVRFFVLQSTVKPSGTVSLLVFYKSLRLSS